MNISDISAVSGLSSMPLQTQTPRTVGTASAQQFRELMAAPECDAAQGPCEAQPNDAAKLQATTPNDSAASAATKLHQAMDMDIEKVLMANLPSADASMAEFAVGMLRAQVKVSQAAIAIEMVSKTTQSLSQGVQSLTTRG
jgi:hypothetical protein